MYVGVDLGCIVYLVVSVCAQFVCVVYLYDSVSVFEFCVCCVVHECMWVWIWGVLCIL